MNQSPDEIKQWFDGHKDRLLNIRKAEDGDQDWAEIRLQDVEFVNHNDTDDYLSAQALILKGAGTVNTNHGKDNLPYEFYEIALTDQWSSKTDVNSLHLHTERGTYTIEVETNA